MIKYSAMGIKKIAVLAVLIVGVLAAAGRPAAGQLVMGQYEDEAPLRTWNTFAFSAGASLGRGETSFSLAADCSAALANPALLLTLPKVSVTLNGSYSRASLFKYSVVNTGVVRTAGNPALGLYALDFGGASFRFGRWAAAVLISLTEIYDRPQCKAEESYRGVPYYSLDFSQSGSLKTIHLSLARSFGERWAFGLGLNYLTGDLAKDLTEDYPTDGITIADHKEYDFKGISLNGGLCVRLSERWTAGLVLRTPFHKSAKGESLITYSVPRAGTDISISASSEDTFRLPLILGAGVSFLAASRFRISADVAWHNWARYRAESFGEPQERNFRDVFKLGAGAEYSASFSFFKKIAVIPLRLGVVVDPQPMKNPKSVYYSLTLGTGLHRDPVYLDIGFITGKETGSGNSLSGRRLAVSLAYQY